MINSRGTQKQRSDKGDGCLRIRPDGRYEYILDCGRDENGKRITKVVSAKTLNEVKAKKKALLESKKAGTLDAPDMTLNEWSGIWMDEYAGNLKPATALKYRQDLKNHILPVIGGKKLREITAVMIQGMINHLSLSPKSVKNVFGVCHACFDRAVQIKYIGSNPCVGVVLPRREKPDIEPFDVEEMRKLLTVCNDFTKAYDVIINLALMTGMRQAELLGLEWKRVDLKKGSILISKQLAYPRTKESSYELIAPKNGKPRGIQVGESVVNVLKEWKSYTLENRLEKGQLWAPDEGLEDLVFTSEYGKPLHPSGLMRYYKAKLEEAGLHSFRFHDLRHGFATAGLMAGVDIKTVQEELGHATPSFTLSVYSHVTESMKKSAADKMDLFLRSNISEQF